MKQRLPNLIQARGLTEAGVNPIKANLCLRLACDLNFDHPITYDLNESHDLAKKLSFFCRFKMKFPS